MQRIVFIGALFFAASAFAAVQADCPTTTCLKTGDSCAPACGACFTDFGTCLGNAAGAQPANCACMSTAVTCINARADSAICQTGLKGFYNSLQPNCTSYAGDNCTTCATIAAFANPNPIRNTATCNPTTDYCNGNNICSTKLGPGVACTAKDTCVDYYTCNSGTCQRIGKSVANDLCTANTDCIAALNCTGTTCAGKAAGAACALNGECNPGLYCNSTGVCSAYLAAGAACLGSAEECGLNAVCGAGDKCVTPYVAANGAACKVANFSPSECVPGSYCNAGTCASAPTFPTCNNDTDCSANVGSTCQCVVGTSPKGTCSATVFSNANVANCLTQATALLTCVTGGNCRQVLSPDGQTCMGSKCKAQYNAYVGCLYPSAYTTLCAVPTSAATGATGGSAGASGTKTNDASTLCGAAAVLLGAAALL